MTHDEAFLQAIRDEPDSDAPRLIYADWLEEHGQEARAEFIRLQCERARPGTDPARAAELEARSFRLLADNWEAWVGPLRELVGPDGARQGEAWLLGGPHPDGLFRFRRGFVQSLALRAEVFVARGGDLARLAPLRHLRLWGAESHAAALAASPHLEGLAALDFADYYTGPLTAAGAEALAASPHLGRLRALHLYRNNLGDAGFRALVRAPWLGQLGHLNVVDNGLSEAAARALAEVTPLRLTVLQMGGNRLGGAGAAALAGAPGLAGLTALDLGNADVGPAGLAALAASDNLRNLRKLDLDHNPLGPSAGAALAEARFLPGLAELYLNYCRLHNDDVETLVRSRGVASLTCLGLNGNFLGDRGARALAAAPHLARLTTLGLQGNAITADGAAALRASPHLRRLTSLNLQGNPSAQGT
jgi:uncharacterized protein (TIGR02996 family)